MVTGISSLTRATLSVGKIAGAAGMVVSTAHLGSKLLGQIEAKPQFVSKGKWHDAQPEVKAQPAVKAVLNEDGTEKTPAKPAVQARAAVPARYEVGEGRKIVGKAIDAAAIVRPKEELSLVKALALGGVAFTALQAVAFARGQKTVVDFGRWAFSAVSSKLGR